MKKLAFIFSLFICTAASAQEQAAKTAEVKIDKAAVARQAELRTEQLDKIVTLTKQQRADIMAIHTDIEEKAAWMKGSGQESEKAVTDLENARIQLISRHLTDDQMMKLKATYR